MRNIKNTLLNKLVGLLLIGLGLVTVCIDSDGTALIILATFGIWLIVQKRNVFE